MATALLFGGAFMLAGASQGMVAAQANLWSGKAAAPAAPEAPVYAPEGDAPWSTPKAASPATETPDDTYAPADLDARLSTPPAPLTGPAPTAPAQPARPWSAPYGAVSPAPSTAARPPAGSGTNPPLQPPGRRAEGAPPPSSTGLPPYGAPYGIAPYGGLPYGALPYGTGLLPYGTGVPGPGFGLPGFW